MQVRRIAAPLLTLFALIGACGESSSGTDTAGSDGNETSDGDTDGDTTDGDTTDGDTDGDTTDGDTDCLAEQIDCALGCCQLVAETVEGTTPVLYLSKPLLVDATDNLQTSFIKLKPAADSPTDTTLQHAERSGGAWNQLGVSSVDDMRATGATLSLHPQLSPTVLLHRIDGLLMIANRLPTNVFVTVSVTDIAPDTLPLVAMANGHDGTNEHSIWMNSDANTLRYAIGDPLDPDFDANGGFMLEDIPRSTTGVPEPAGLVIDSEERPLFAYHADSSVWLAVRDGAWTHQTPDGMASAALDLRLSPDGEPSVLLTREGGAWLATRSGETWSSEEVHTPDASPGAGCLAYDSSGGAHALLEVSTGSASSEIVYARRSEGAWHMKTLVSDGWDLFDGIPCTFDSADRLHALYINDAQELIHLSLE